MNVTSLLADIRAIDRTLAENSAFSLKIIPRVGRWKSDWGQLRVESVISQMPKITASSG